MDRMEDQLTGPDILMKDGDLGGEQGARSTCVGFVWRLLKARFAGR